MAKELNEGSAARGVAGHNVENRKQILRNSLEQTYLLDKEIASATERHLKTPREAKSAIKKRIREDLNLPAKVFNARYAMYKLERQAQDLEDNTTLDAIKEMAEMAPVGAQVDMVDAMEKVDKKEAAAKKNLGKPIEEFEEDPEKNPTGDGDEVLRGVEPQGEA